MNALDYVRLSSSPSAWVSFLYRETVEHQRGLLQALREVEAMRVERDAANERARLAERDAAVYAEWQANNERIAGLL